MRGKAVGHSLAIQRLRLSATNNETSDGLLRVISNLMHYSRFDEVSR